MTVIEQPTLQLRLPPRPPIIDAGWYPDPRLEHNLRYFDGSRWTEHVTHFGPTPCDRCT